jgi:hypothetical protein
MSVPSEDLSPREEDINAALGFFPLVGASLAEQPRDTGEGAENDFDARPR